MEDNIKKGQEIELDIETLAFGGRGIAKANGFVVFVENAIPGQRVKARVYRKRKGFAEARALEILQRSPEEVEARCPHFGECGGCRSQNLDYKAQLKYKHQQVVESLERLGGFEKPPVLETLASPEQFYYRNKMEYSFGRKRWVTKSEVDAEVVSKPKDFALGLHIRGRFDKILDLDTCFLQSPESVEILNFVREFVLQTEIPAYSTKDHTGFWRHLVIREGKNTGERLINLVTAENPKHDNVVEKLAAKLIEKFEDTTTVIQNINRKKAQIAFGDEERILFGPGCIQEKIGDRTFQISANSFFQTNTKGAEILYEKVVEFADFRSDETVFDLYCGAATISLYIANKVKEVVGFELIRSAVKDAKFNCQLNGVENCSFVAGDLKDSLKLSSDNSDKLGQPSTVIIDPPRAGMHENVVHAVLKLQPEKIVYVSCNPATFARDAKALCLAEYELMKVQPVDMFPMTPHIELVSLLKRVEN
ncbi:23S rRNA (uracil(1939)-C(5))-methyltransferase RlmD [candidate division KSB1 bacterium]|nr:23S rRNA (uracil(1939)-C(5))-methyltransferase RlmD [candidate division KSB1 bacterium]